MEVKTGKTTSSAQMHQSGHKGAAPSHALKPMHGMMHHETHKHVTDHKETHHHMEGHKEAMADKTPISNY